jgi:DNA-binding beta-propeller fold protein YncE
LTCVVACVALVVSGCAEQKAAEPAAAPAPTVAPAGRVVPVGDQPEGIVADPVTHLVAVGVRNPTGLALVDAGTGQVTVRVPLPGHVRHLQLAAPGGPVLVPDEDADTLLTVALPAGTVQDRIKVGDYPHDATATDNGTIAVTDELGGTLDIIRAGRIVHRFHDPVQPGGLAAVDHRVGLVDVRDNTLTLYDTTAMTRTARVSAGDGPTHIVADRAGRFLVADTRGDQLLIFSTTPYLRQIDSVLLPGSPYGLAYDPTRDQLWVTLTARNQLVGLTVGDAPVREFARFATVRQPNTVAVDPGTGTVFVTSRTDGTLQLINPTTDRRQ